MTDLSLTLKGLDLYHMKFEFHLKIMEDLEFLKIIEHVLACLWMMDEIGWNWLMPYLDDTIALIWLFDICQS